MTPDEFRRHGREVVDWIADYLERVESLPVLSPVEPGQVRDLLPEHPPERGEPFDALLADMDRVVPHRNRARPSRRSSTISAAS